MKVAGLDILRCDAGWRNYHFLKLSTDAGIVGWSEFDEGFGLPGVDAVIERLAARVAGQEVSDHERIYAELYCLTRPGAGSVVAEGLGAIENALLDAKAKALGVPCHALFGGKLRDRVPVYWSHCATWRINHPQLYPPAITGLDGVRAIGAEARGIRSRASDPARHAGLGHRARRRRDPRSPASIRRRAVALPAGGVLTSRRKFGEAQWRDST